VIPRRIEDRGGGLARVNGRPRLVEGLAMPREEDEFRLRFYNTLSTWIDIDQLLAAFGLSRDDLTNEARVAGGNAAVLQKLEGNEAKVGVLLLENALAAKRKGSPIEIAWPSDGAVVIPGYAGILASSQHAEAAKAVIDALLSPESQKIISSPGDMHAVDPRVAAPVGSVSLDELVQKSAPWDESMLERGLSDGARVKAAFSKAFAQ
jgi:hypothetical protein